MKAIMLAFGCKQQYHTLRAAAAAGYKIQVLGRDLAEGLRYSRYCASFRPLAFDPAAQPLEAALAEISRRAREVSADVILPSDIVSTRLLSALKDRLPAKTCALPDPACFDMVNDKWRFYQFCKQNGVKVPETWLCADVKGLQAAVEEGQVPFPFIIKPHDSMGSRGIFRIRGRDDLKLLSTVDFKPLLVQRLIVGDEIDISIVAHKGRIGAYAIQKFMDGKYVFLRQDQLLAEASRMAEASGFHGIAHLDAIEEKATGEVYMIECNPRVWFSIYAATVSGLNFVELSLASETLDPRNPRRLIGNVVDTGKISLKAILKAMATFSTAGLDVPLVKYRLLDLIGEKYSRMPRFDDMLLPPSSPGSVESQILALTALRKRSPGQQPL